MATLGKTRKSWSDLIGVRYADPEQSIEVGDEASLACGNSFIVTEEFITWLRERSLIDALSITSQMRLINRRVI
jgi:hypothetical protein